MLYYQSEMWVKTSLLTQTYRCIRSTGNKTDRKFNVLGMVGPSLSTRKTIEFRLIFKKFSFQQDMKYNSRPQATSCIAKTTAMVPATPNSVASLICLNAVIIHR